MPYIREDKRKQIESELDQLVIKFLETQDDGGTAGRLNYVISSMIGAILKNDRLLSYARINELIGVLECAKMELYRRVATPYEDDKSRLNGDVY
jgi:hypothetical protein|tara:strand:+ start:1983 stop:2264 length:282 start_codon:yes stop_codon:yes gene_type:complete